MLYTASDDSYKAMLSACHIADLRGKAIVLVVGPMGFGKSTLIGVQIGATFKKTTIQTETANGFKRERVHFELQSCTVKSPQTSSGFVSKTLNVNPYCNEGDGTGLVYVDTAASNEDRSEEVSRWTSWSTATTFRLASSVEAIVAALDYGALERGRANAFRLFAKSIQHVIGGGKVAQYSYDAMVFVVSNAAGVSEENIRATADEIETEYKVRYDAMLRSFAQNYPKRSRTTPTAAAQTESSFFTGRGVLDSMSAAATQLGVSGHAAVDWDKVPTKEKAELNDVLAIQGLARALRNNPIVIACPNGAYYCRQQRTKVLAAIREVKTIGRGQLDEIIGSRKDNNVEVCNDVLARLVEVPNPRLHNMSFRAVMMQLCDLTGDLISKVDTRASDAMIADFDAYKRAKLDEVEEQITAQRQRAGEADNEIRRLKLSDVPKAIHVEQIRIAKHTSFNPVTWFGGGWVEEHKEINNGPYTTYSKHNVNSTTITEVKKRPSDGFLKVKVETHMGNDANVDIHLNVPERDHPNTLSRIAALEADKTEREATLRAKFELKARINTCASAQALTALLFADFAETQDKRNKLTELLNSTLVPMGDSQHELTEMTAFWALGKLQKALKEANAIPLGELTEGAKTSIVEYVDGMTELDGLERKIEANPLLKRVVSMTDKKVSTTVGEDNAAVPTTMQAIADVVPEALGDAAENAIRIVRDASDGTGMQCGLGFALLLVGICRMEVNVHTCCIILGSTLLVNKFYHMVQSGADSIRGGIADLFVKHWPSAPSRARPVDLGHGEPSPQRQSSGIMSGIIGIVGNLIGRLG